MHYKSPFPVLSYSGVDLQEVNDSTLTKAKKILLVELDHAEKGTLNIDGEVFTKNDILLLFESLSNAEHIIYHRWVHENPGLRALLENKSIDNYEVLFDKSLLNHEKIVGFKAFISPFLAQPLGKILSQAFTRQEYTKGLKVITAAQLVEQSGYDITFGKLQSNIRGIIQELKIFNERGAEQFKEHQCHYINYYFIQFLNQLPDTFETLREDFATALINLTITIQHKHPHLCKRLYFSLSALNCSEEVKEIIKNNLKVFQRAAEGSSVEKKADPEPQGATALILKMSFMAVLFFILILKNCDNSSSTHSSYKMDFSQPFLHKLTHLKNIQDLKSLSLDQLNYGNKTVSVDSIVDLSDTTIWPYASEYKNLLSYTPETGRKVYLTNESDYDAVVFLSTNLYNYSTFLFSGEKISFYTSNDDYVQFYLGKQWAYGLHSNQTNIRREHFTEIDSTTLTYLESIWQNQCNKSTNCRDSSFSLYVDDSDKVQFSGNTYTSGFRKVNEYFYIKKATDTK
ncbi:hypothetical protein GCM10009122_40630 [Fulvivirga kasyanovii]|uniref:Uncharacterized protein n=1 Tax=Fulvivirga kasyanovii TaxID=396812 RepID=A0ABW9RYM9_9BACT|nr:hypothetical protein [Fulvivirga kasyanovii]MTI28323.1 hypothetical protein [Fulvivirga kasyanovii]